MLVLFYLVTVIVILSGYLLGNHDTWFMDIFVGDTHALLNVNN